ncbi:MFS general substrate transporter [Yamadazyma tenuis ATCC 10573]|uniref:MFS general substrate transporter n=1 Tax=Candida tenuis (strain ATCC 10573 / BCRC 21748 / CBS 615 / JCM 9827 / NBRC 10315 / NRRL Y-1498 / VKM Y-70) TaxID=590646 RepID=G3AXI0_CANTC|nr:MFS general substrate transporter [Yamadazyma tenuis ATCC 10573]EGV66386.1 MFS general substrate transporter [Yamadazyma tenuis ATCC 10573]
MAAEKTLDAISVHSSVQENEPENTNSLDLKEQFEVKEDEYSVSIKVSEEEEAYRKSWKFLIWDTWGHPNKAHVKVIRKVDLTLLAFATVSTFIKYIDKSNLTAAYVSGMQEDLKIFGNELNYANTAYNIACILCGYPFGYLMARFSTRWLIIFVEVAWIIITFSFSSIQTPLQMIVLRCLLGIFECAHYPALSFLLGTYYTPAEFARRNVILQSATALGSMFASYIQSGAYTHLNGVLGRSGWRWVFIIDGIISVGVLIPQIVFFPDILARNKPSFVFSEEDLQYLKERKPETKYQTFHFGWEDVKKVFTTWEVWAFWSYGMSQDIVSLSMPSFIFWLKAYNVKKPGTYSIPQVNNFNSILYAVQYLVAVGTGWWSDTALKGRRWPPIVLAGVISFVVMILLASTPVYPDNKGFRFFLYLNTCWALGTAGIYWAHVQEYFKDDIRLRAITTGGINIYSFTADSIINPIWFKTQEQPNVRTGHYISAFFAVVYAAVGGLLGWKEHTLRRKRLSKV